MDSFFLSQLLAAGAFITDLASFQFKQRRYILFLLFISSTLLGFHFILLKQEAAAILVFIAAVRFLLAFVTTSSVVMFACILAAPLTIFLGSFTWKTIFALLGSVLVTWAAFRPTDYEVRTRMMVGTTFWIIHNALIRSPAGIFVEAFFLCSNLVGYWRFYGRKASKDRNSEL